MSDGICDECGTDAEMTLELIDELIAAKSDLTSKLAEAENKAMHYESEWGKCSNYLQKVAGERDELRAEVERLRELREAVLFTHRMIEGRSRVWAGTEWGFTVMHPATVKAIWERLDVALAKSGEP